MAFKEVYVSPAISLGGVNKKTNQANPTQLEGYYLRTKQHEDKKKRNGLGYTHEFQTATGFVTVWGKTDMDRKLRQVNPGTMVKVTWTGETKPTPNGDMQIYKVAEDPSNTIEVPGEAEVAAESATEDYADAEEEPADETPPQRATRPAIPATAPSAASKAAVERLLGNRTKQTA